MKQFFKMALAAMCGYVAASLATIIFFITFIGNLFTTGEGPRITQGSVLKIDLSEIALIEQSKPANLQEYMQGSALPGVSVWDAVQAVRKAARDPRISLIYLKPDGATAGISQIEELRQALAEFRQSGKAVITFSEFPTTGAYWLATASDKIYLSANTGSGPQLTGVGTQLIFLGDLLNKLDVNVQLIRHGKFKSAGETLTKGSPSEENLLQNRQMVLSIWNTIAQDISKARGIEVSELERLVNNLLLNSGKDMIDAGLADELMTREQMKEKLATLAMKPSYEDVNLVSLRDYSASVNKGGNPARDQIAILIADGEIVEGTDVYNIDGDRYASQIAALRKNDKVKAVVLRVSSPGGSVLASDKIKTEIDLLRGCKPVIASYGDYAASGGYWISNSCDHIFTDNTTITGSIGVFALIPDISKTLRNKLNVNVVTVSSGNHNGGLLAPLDAQEKQALQKQIDDIYTSFVSNVAQGRELEPSYVDEIAQGRVWTGAEALGIGLADECGTLMDAVKYAASLVGISDISQWNICTYPTVEPTLLDELISQSEILPPTDDGIKGAVKELSRIEGTLLKWYKSASGERFFARLPYDLDIK